MKCFFHPDKDAAALCNRCGKSICEECRVQMQGENYCKECISQKAEGKRHPPHSPSLAAILSFIFAGAGQIYNGQIAKGILIFITSWLVIPWIIGIFDAYHTAKKIREKEITPGSRPGCMIAAIAAIAAFFFMVFFIALLAAIAIPNLLRARMSANEAAAKSTIASIASAAQVYHAEKGVYPGKDSDLSNYLTGGIPAERYGYAYKILFTPDSYRIMASPVKCKVSGFQVFTLESTGEKIKTEECLSDDGQRP